MSEEDLVNTTADSAATLEPKRRTEDCNLPDWIYANAVQQLPVAVCISDVDSNIVYANPAFTEVTGYSVSEVIGKKTSLLSHQCTPPRIYEQMWDRLVHSIYAVNPLLVRVGGQNVACPSSPWWSS